MKVLLLSYRQPPEPGAASARASSIAEALRRRGHEVHLPRLWVPGLAYRGYLRRLLIYLGFFLSYSWFLASRRPRPDVIYYVSPFGLSPLSLPACIYSKFVGAKSVLDVHDLYTFAFLSPVLADRIIHVEDSLLGLDMDPIVESQDFGFTPLTSDRAKRNGVTVMCSGNPSGLDLETFSAVSKKLPHLEFRICPFGEGPRLSFLSDLSEADIFVVPTRKGFDQMPTKAAEYMALGKPVMYVGRGKMAEIIVSNCAGLVRQRDDVDGIADDIRFLAEDRSVREWMGYNAQRTAEELFSLDAFGRRLEALMA